MTDELPTLWPAEPHTLAKHAILRTYLQAWAAILSRSRTANELLFVDAFAGPGEYQEGEPGSPIVALEAIQGHSAPDLKPVRFLFIESRRDRHEHLRGRLVAYRDRIQPGARVRVSEPVLGDCDPIIRKLINEYDGGVRPVGPALFFLDQFGYSQVSMSLVREIMRHPQWEVFSYLNFLRMNQFLRDESKWDGITAAYGNQSWKAALDLQGDEREKFLLNTYKAGLQQDAGVRFVWPFAMLDSQGRLIHWLIFSTNHLKGLFEMKKAMWKADESGAYRFSDRVDPRQQRFLSGFDQEWLADEVPARLAGRTVREDELEEFVLTQTPCYLYKKAVRLLRGRRMVKPLRRDQDWPIRFT